jgi:hypothetical protein
MRANPAPSKTARHPARDKAVPSPSISFFIPRGIERSLVRRWAMRTTLASVTASAVALLVSASCRDGGAEQEHRSRPERSEPDPPSSTPTKPPPKSVVFKRVPVLGAEPPSTSTVPYSRFSLGELTPLFSAGGFRCIGRGTDPPPGDYTIYLECDSTTAEPASARRTVGVFIDCNLHRTEHGNLHMMLEQPRFRDTPENAGGVWVYVWCD